MVLYSLHVAKMHVCTVFGLEVVHHLHPVLALSPFGFIVLSFFCQKISLCLSRSIFSSVDLVSSLWILICSIGCSTKFSSKLHVVESAKCSTSLQFLMFFARWCLLQFILVFNFSLLLPTYCFLCIEHSHKYTTQFEVHFKL